MTPQELHAYFLQCLLDLSTEEGINAAGKEEIYGCIFGRDSAITVLKILKAYKKNPQENLLEICRKTLLTLVNLQGREFNIESGEEPGKMIHEFRKEKYEHLLKLEKPWYLYPDGFLRNYDSIDSTSLTLIALYRYWEISQDNNFLVKILPAVEAGLNWQISYGDKDRDSLLEYEFPLQRTHGGLVVQSWTDSHESMQDLHGQMPIYPIAPVEAQGYAWLALKLWGRFYNAQHPRFGKRLLAQARKMKKEFNNKFIIMDKNMHFAAQALDGKKNKISTITANPLLCLWAADIHNGKTESIFEDTIVESIVNRAFMSDLFVEDAGIRTMSSDSPTFNPGEDSYHNGSFWPMLNGLIIEGLENFSYTQHAKQLRNAATLPLLHFKCPIELYVKKDNSFVQFCGPDGQVSCKTQAWSAAAALDFLLE